MKKLKSLILIGFSLLGLSSCSDLIYDDLEDCPTGVRVNLVGIPLTLTPTVHGTPYNPKSGYDYVNDATFFVYDSNNTLAYKYTAKDLIGSNYQVMIPTGAGDYSIYCWTGGEEKGGEENGSYYDYSGTVAGTSTKDEFLCSYLSGDANNAADVLPPMGYGKVGQVTVVDHAITNVDMDLISNKKVIAVVCRYATSNTSVSGVQTGGDENMTDFRFAILSDNRVYDAENNIVPVGSKFMYQQLRSATPDIVEDVDENGNSQSYVINSVALNTLRLIDGDISTRFVIRDKENNTICDIPIARYLTDIAIAKIYSGLTSASTVQEFLDYTNEYDVIVNLVEAKEQEAGAKFRVESIQIGDWIFNGVNMSGELIDHTNTPKGN